MTEAEWSGREVMHVDGVAKTPEPHDGVVDDLPEAVRPLVVAGADVHGAVHTARGLRTEVPCVVSDASRSREVNHIGGMLICGPSCVAGREASTH